MCTVNVWNGTSEEKDVKSVLNTLKGKMEGVTQWMAPWCVEKKDGQMDHGAARDIE